MNTEEVEKKYKHLLAFIGTLCDPKLRLLAMFSNEEMSNDRILRVIGQDESELVIAQAKDTDFIPTLKLEVGYEEKANFKENVEDVVDYLRSVDLGTIFN